MKFFGNGFPLRLPAFLKKKESIVSADRVAMDKRLGAWMQWLDAEKLASAIDNFNRGDLESLARIWAEISERDDVLIDVVDKRTSAVAQLPWEITAKDNSAEAKKHKEALQFLYDNLTATSVREPNETGGVTLLLEQMMDCVGYKYSVHELIWQPEGATLTVTMNHLPIWYFESRQGKLRYRPDLYSYDGSELEDNAWLITVGRGLLKASAIAYLCKHMPLKDWVIFCDHFGFPGILGKTNAPFDSPEWKQMVEMVGKWKGDRAGVVSLAAELEQMELGAGASFPYKDLVERMDRAMAIMWRGGDLSTMAKGDGVGSNRQQEESDAMRNREAARISETLNEQVDIPAIQWLFGTQPKAWFTLKPPARVKVDEEIRITEHLVNHGVPVSQADEARRFGRSVPGDGEALLTVPANPADQLAGLMAGDDPAAANARPTRAQFAAFINAARNELGNSLGKDAGPLLDLLAAIREMPDPAAQREALAKFHRDFPNALTALISRGPATAAAWQAIIGTSYFNGLAAGQKARNPKSPTSRENPGDPASGPTGGSGAPQAALNAS